jgi:phosphoribosylanthranilate isomerase
MLFAMRDFGRSARSAPRASPYRASARPAERLLLDAEEPGAGVPFDVTALGGARPTGFWLLAGGLTPENVAERIRVLSPCGVDVSSGVESERGVKSLARIAAFVDAVRATGAEPTDAEPTDAEPAAAR